MASFLVNKRGCSACPEAGSPRKVSDYGLPRNGGTPKLKGSALDGAKIKKRLTRDQVGEILNPGAMKTRWRKPKNHSQENYLMIKALQTARANERAEEKQLETALEQKGLFNMPRFIAVKSKDLVPDVLQRDDDRRRYAKERQQVIKEQNQRTADAQRAASEALAITTEQRNKVVERFLRPSKQETKEVILGRSKIRIPIKKKAKSVAYQAPSHKGPRGLGPTVGYSSRPQTAPAKRVRYKLREHLKVPVWWASQAGPYEILHVGSLGC
jgi:hypothetical protein